MQEAPFRILTCASQGMQMVFADTDHQFGKHTHEQFGVGLILRGAQKSASQCGVVEASAGDIITVNPEEVHDGTPLGEGGRAWQMLYLDVAVVQATVADLNETGPQARMEFAQPCRRDPALTRMFRHHAGLVTRSSSHWTLPADESLLLLLQALLRPACPKPGHADLNAITRAKSWIDAQPAHAWTLAELAREADLSRFQFIRHFGRATGLTPHAYIVQRRIHLARQMIRQGGSLRDVAASCGFADQSHMTRQFVRCFGLSPGAYARAVSGARPGL